MKPLLKLLFALLSLFSFDGSLRAQGLDGAFFALHQAIGELEERNDPILMSQTDLSSLRQRVGRLQDGAVAIDEAHREAYAASLLAQAAVLSEAARGDGTAQARSLSRLLINMVAEDLSIKDQARAGLGLGAPIRGHVRVGAFTLRGAARVAGYVIGATPVAVRSTTPLYRFPNVTTINHPSVHDIPPGRYNFVILRDNRRVGGEQALPVGLQGQETMSLDLPLDGAER